MTGGLFDFLRLIAVYTLSHEEQPCSYYWNDHPDWPCCLDGPAFALRDRTACHGYDDCVTSRIAIHIDP